MILKEGHITFFFVNSYYMFVGRVVGISKWVWPDGLAHLAQYKTWVVLTKFRLNLFLPSLARGGLG